MILCVSPGYWALRETREPAEVYGGPGGAGRHQVGLLMADCFHLIIFTDLTQNLYTVLRSTEEHSLTGNIKNDVVLIHLLDILQVSWFSLFVLFRKIVFTFHNKTRSLMTHSQNTKNINTWRRPLLQYGTNAVATYIHQNPHSHSNTVKYIHTYHRLFHVLFSSVIAVVKKLLLNFYLMN